MTYRVINRFGEVFASNATIAQAETIKKLCDCTRETHGEVLIIEKEKAGENMTRIMGYTERYFNPETNALESR